MTRDPYRADISDSDSQRLTFRKLTKVWSERREHG
jgi:hypothetical protein